MPHPTASLLRATTWLTLVLGAVYAVMLVPGVRPTPGYQPAIDWWLNMTVDALVIVVLAVRTAGRPQGPGGLADHDRGAARRLRREHRVLRLLPAPRPHPEPLVGGRRVAAASTPCSRSGSSSRLRARARSMPFSLSLDGLIAGLTAAALAETYVPGARSRSDAAASPR